jgi:hypothetical protein
VVGIDPHKRCANRTPRVDRARGRGKSDQLDCERIARETPAHPLLPRAFRRAGQDHGVDETHELLALWHNQRFSIRKSRQHLLEVLAVGHGKNLGLDREGARRSRALPQTATSR